MLLLQNSRGADYARGYTHLRLHTCVLRVFPSEAESCCGLGRPLTLPPKENRTLKASRRTTVTWLAQEDRRRLLNHMPQ